jgi:hypothetical protein
MAESPSRQSIRDERAQRILDGISADTWEAAVKAVQNVVAMHAVGLTDWELPKHGAEDVLAHVINELAEVL